MTSPHTAPALDDRELIASAQLGDRQAFGELVCRHQKSVVSVIYRMCGDPRLAEDAAQEAFVRVETDQRAARVRQAVARLSEPLRLVLVLREYEELSYHEIAAALEIPLGTVMSRLNTARIQLRRELDGLLEAT